MVYNHLRFDPKGTTSMPVHHQITNQRIDQARETMDCCPTCSRTGNPVWDVTTARELAEIFGLSDALPRQTVRLKYMEAVHSGLAWLFRWAEAQERWGDADLPAFLYWKAPEIPCPTCGRTGDPLHQVITLTEVPSLPGQNAHQHRYALTTAPEITYRRKAGSTLLFDREQVEQWAGKHVGK